MPTVAHYGTRVRNAPKQDLLGHAAIVARVEEPPFSSDNLVARI